MAAQRRSRKRADQNVRRLDRTVAGEIDPGGRSARGVRSDVIDLEADVCPAGRNVQRKSRYGEIDIGQQWRWQRWRCWWWWRRRWWWWRRWRGRWRWRWRWR